MASHEAPAASARPRLDTGYGPMLGAVLALVAAAMLALGAASAWWVAHEMQRQALERSTAQQIDEVDTVARMLAARLEQQQRLLLVLAQGMAAHAGDASWLLNETLHGDALPARLFDSLQLADSRGQLQISLRSGRAEPLADLDEAVRDAMRRSLVDGKPVISTLLRKGPEPGMMELLYAVPLRAGNGMVGGVLSAGMRMSAQALLAPSINVSRTGSRLLVIQRDGQILAHTDPEHWLGRTESEEGLGGDWLQQVQANGLQVRPVSEQRGAFLVTSAGMPLPQWLVVKVTPLVALAPGLSGGDAWRVAAMVLGATVLLVLALALLTHPLAALHRSARRWLAAGTPVFPELPVTERADDAGRRMPWDMAWGEAATLWQAMHRLGEQGREQTQEVRRLQLQIQTLMDYAPVGLVVTRAAHLDLVGLQAARMLGYRPHELQGMAISALCQSQQAHDLLLERVRRALDMYGQFDSEHCFVRKDGRPIWVRLHGQSVQRLQRGVEPVAAVATDPALVWVIEDVTMQRLMREQPGWKALHDPLTLLPNHEAFALRLQDWLKECSVQAPLAVAAQPGGGLPAEPAGTGHHGVILFLDLDHFAHVNQQGGHAAGDEVLCHMARLIESVVRPLGWVARLGGDEFAVLLTGVSQQQGMLLAQSLCMAVQDWEGSHEGQRYLMGASVGMVVLNAEHHTVSSALRGADMACYAAKRKGRNRVEVLSTP